MSDQTATRAVSGTIDLLAAPMEIGTQVADIALPVMQAVATRFTGLERALVWHGFMAALTGAMAGQVGHDDTREILRSMGLCVDQMEAEIAARKGAH